MYIVFFFNSSSWSISFQGSEELVVITGRDGLECLALGSTFVLGVAGGGWWSVGGGLFVE